jgi:hypothetical protein
MGCGAESTLATITTLPSADAASEALPAPARVRLMDFVLEHVDPLYHADNAPAAMGSKIVA